MPQVMDWPSGSPATWPQEPSAMMEPGRLREWPAGTQVGVNAAQRLLSQAVGWWDAAFYTPGDRFLRNHGTGAELLDLALGGNGRTATSNDPQFLPVEDTGYVYVTGVTSNSMSVPDEAALDITGDIDIRVRCALDDWTPASAQCVLGKRSTNASTTQSYSFDVNPNGTLTFRWTDSGAVNRVLNSSDPTGIGDGEARWVRVEFDADNGAGQCQAKFYLSDDGTTWTQLGTTTVGNFGTSSIIVDAQRLDIGARSGAASGMSTGKFYRAQVISDPLGTPATVLDVDCNAITSGSATSFTAVTGQTVTINRSTSGRKAVAMPSRWNGGRACFLFGTDDYMEVAEAWQQTLLNFGNGQPMTVVIVTREWGLTSVGTTLIAKRIAYNINNSGWSISSASGGVQADFRLGAGDGVNQAVVLSPSRTSGSITVLAGVRNSAAGTATHYRNGVAGTTLADIRTSLVNSEVVRVGRISGVGTAYNDMELSAAAIFRRGLSNQEIATIVRHYTGA